MNYPLDRLLSKAFLRPVELPECELALGLLGCDIANYDRRFKALRTGRATWETLGCGMLPLGLEKIPPYWSVPWMQKVRKPMTMLEQVKRQLAYPILVRRFQALVSLMVRTRRFPGEPPKAIKLVDGSREVCIFLDANKRLGIAAALGLEYVPLAVQGLFDYRRTLVEGRTRFSTADIDRWWNWIFVRVYGA